MPFCPSKTIYVFTLFISKTPKQHRVYIYIYTVAAQHREKNMPCGNHLAVVARPTFSTPLLHICNCVTKKKTYLQLLIFGNDIYFIVLLIQKYDGSNVMRSEVNGRQKKLTTNGVHIYFPWLLFIRTVGCLIQRSEAPQIAASHTCTTPTRHELVKNSRTLVALYCSSAPFKP